MPWNMSWNCNMCVFLLESVPPEEHCPSHCRNWSLLARWSTLISWLLARPGTSNGHSGDQDWLGPLLGIVNRPMYRCCDALRMVSWVPAVSSANFDILYRLYTKVDMFWWILQLCHNMKRPHLTDGDWGEAASIQRCTLAATQRCVKTQWNRYKMV